MAFLTLTRRRIATLAGAASLTLLGGCYDGGIYGASDYASNYACGAGYYDMDPFGYDDGYGYGCYDPSDYRSGFANIGFGGGWYDDFYYPGHGTWMYDRYNVRRPLSGHYLNYWGGRRAYHRHYQGRPDRWQGRPLRPAPNYAPNRPSRPPEGVVRPDRPDRPSMQRPPRGDGAGRGDNRQDRPGLQRPQRPEGEVRPDRRRPTEEWRRDRQTRPQVQQPRPDGQVQQQRQTRPTRAEPPQGQARSERQVRPQRQAQPQRQMRTERQPSEGSRNIRSPQRPRSNEQ